MSDLEIPPTTEEQIKVKEQEYARKAMFIGDAIYKIFCMFHECAAINNDIIALKTPKGEQSNGETA